MVDLRTKEWYGFGCPECHNGAHQEEVGLPIYDDRGNTVVLTRRCQDCRIQYDLFYKLQHAIEYDVGPGRAMLPSEPIIPQRRPGER
jgi:hypothetical protein